MPLLCGETEYAGGHNAGGHNAWGGQRRKWKTAEQRANEMLKHQCFITPFNAVKPIKHLMFTAALGKWRRVTKTRKCDLHDLKSDKRCAHSAMFYKENSHCTRNETKKPRSPRKAHTISQFISGRLGAHWNLHIAASSEVVVERLTYKCNFVLACMATDAGQKYDLTPPGLLNA